MEGNYAKLAVKENSHILNTAMEYNTLNLNGFVSVSFLWIRITSWAGSVSNDTDPTETTENRK